MHRRNAGEGDAKENAVDDDDSSNDPLLIAASSDEDDDPQAKNKQAPTTLRKYKDILLRWLKFYVRYLQTSPFHQDRLLKALQWTLWLASAVALDTNKTRASAALSKLSTELSFARYATRLLELPTAIEAAITGSWTSVSENMPRFTTWVGRCLSWSMIGYYPLELAAYVLWMLPPKMQTHDVSQKASKFSAISCRFWLLYIVADAAQCSVLQSEKKTEKEKNASAVATCEKCLVFTPSYPLVFTKLGHKAVASFESCKWINVGGSDGELVSNFSHCGDLEIYGQIELSGKYSLVFCNDNDGLYLAPKILRSKVFARDQR